MVLKTIPLGVGLPIADGVKFINDAIEAEEQTRVELDQAILSGDSSPLAGQLSVGSDAVTYPSAQERFLQERSAVTSQLAETLKQGEVSVSDIDKNKGLINETYLADTLKAQMAGTTAIGSTPPDKSILPIKTTFFQTGKNLFDKNTAILNKQISPTTGAIVTSTGYFTSYFIEVLSNTIYTRSNEYHMAFYDEAMVFISGINAADDIYTFSTPLNTKYIRVSSDIVNIDTLQVELGSATTNYEAYEFKIGEEFVNLPDIKTDDITDRAVTQSKTDFLNRGKNLFDKSAVTDGYYVREVNGNLSANVSHYASEFIKVDENTQYIFSGNTSLRVVFYDINQNYITGFLNPTMPLTSPSLAVFMRFSSSINIDVSQLEKGSIATTFEEYGYKLDKLLLEGVAKEEELLVFLPSEICVAVGRTIELYNKQVIWSGNPNNYHFKWVCAIGRSMKRKFTVEGSSLKIGSYPLTLTIFNNNMKQVAIANTTIKIVDNVFSSAVNILPIGDSLTNNKAWQPELRVLSNDMITLLGTRGTAPLNHEGYSGWTSSHFLTVMDTDSFQAPEYTLTVSDVIETPVVDKEYIMAARFLIKSTNIVNGSGTIVIERITNGTISLSSGTMEEVETATIGDASIIYSNAQAIPLNPFWDGTRFNYNYYKTENVIAPNAIQIFLGTNGITLDPTINADSIKQIVDYIRQDDLTIPIYIVNTLYRSDQNGIGNQTSNDGFSAGSGTWKIEEDRKVFNLIVKVHELLNTYTDLYFIPIALTHDSEYNFGAVETVVNPRSNITEPMPIEGTHPQLEGYLQMADIIFSTIVNAQ